MIKGFGAVAPLTVYQLLGAGTVVAANHLQGTAPPGTQMTPLESTFAAVARQLFPPVRQNVAVMNISQLAGPRSRTYNFDMDPVLAAAMIHFGVERAIAVEADELTEASALTMATGHVTAIFPDRASDTIWATEAIQASEIDRFQLALNTLQPDGTISALFSSLAAAKSVLAHQQRWGLVHNPSVTNYCIYDVERGVPIGDLFVVLTRKRRDTDPPALDAVRAALRAFDYGRPTSQRSSTGQWLS